jgi:hypothetical protein
MISTTGKARPAAGRPLYWVLTVALALAISCTSARAGLAQAGLNPDGSPNPITQVPFWYLDDAGTVLELNLHPTLGISAPPVVGNAFSQQIGYGDEAFYWSADATVTTSAGQALLIHALEVAFDSATGAPEAGTQMVFSRTRILIDVPVAGTYTVTHPYGSKQFTVTTPGTKAINDTVDIGLTPMVFTTVLATPISPFLKWDAGLPIKDANGQDYIGDGTTPHAVTGSPTGFNKFRVDGPVGSNLGGAGIDFVETNLFLVTGKIAVNPGLVPTPLTVNSATYSRTATGAGEVNVVATSNADATGRVQGGPNLPGAFVTMTNNGTGTLSVNIPLTDARTLPATIAVIAVSGTLAPVQLNPPLVDAVVITKAEFYQDAGILRVLAASSDQLAPTPLLTLASIGNLSNGRIDAALATPPATVTVTSAKGGLATATVVLKGPLPPELTMPTAPVSGPAGKPFSAPFTVAGGDPMTFSATGLPPRLSVTKGLVSGVGVQVGTFEVTITATNASDTVTGTMTIVLTEPVISGPASQADSDDDGFPDELEAELGTSRLDPEDTPMNDQPGTDMQPTGIIRAAIKLNFRKPTAISDSIQLSGAIPQLVGFAPANVQVTVDVGGVVRTFTLGAKGISLDKALKINPKTGKFSLRMKGSFAAKLEDEGLHNSTELRHEVTVPIFILAGNIGWYGESRRMLYNSKEDRSGSAK